MGETGPAPTTSLQFRSSGKSQAARSRRWLWIGAAIGLAVPLLKTGFGGGFLVAAGFMLLLLGLLDWFFLRPAARAGQVVFTIGPDAVESPRFNTGTKRFAWSDIQGISVESDRGAPALQLQLKPAARSRRVHAPRFRRLVQELSAITLPANDPRAPLLAAAWRASQLLLETLAMESRIVDGRPVAVDPARSAAINAELEQLNAQMVQLVAQLKAPQRR